jgi:hypothetical protein
MLRIKSPSWAHLALIAFVVATPAAAFAQLTKAGVVATLHGTATVSRASLSHPVPLKFKDDVFVQDRVVTGDDSVARILLGGKAIVTVRERSSLTITEVPGVSTVTIGVGRAAIAVAKERMKAGETIEIRTPNAVASIRGTIVIVEVDQTTAQAAPDPAAFTTRFTVITGQVLVRQLQGGQPFGSGVMLGANEQARFTGFTPPITRPLTPSEAGQLSNSFKATKTDPPAAVNAPLITQSQALATQEVNSVTSATQTPTDTGSSDKREDLAVQQAISMTSARETFAGAAATARVLNSLSPTERQELNQVIQQLKTVGSSLNSGLGTVTLSTGTKVILQNLTPTIR